MLRSSSKAEDKVPLLCVDDEPGVLEGLSLHLARRYQVQTATSGAAALQILAGGYAPAVILSDMRMPNMDGAKFLAEARLRAPLSVRMLLTGYTDIDSAIAAVNDGQVFRFLTKPCAPPVLQAAIAAGVEQHRMMTAERVLLEHTLHGAIKTLTDVLALTSPAAFGRATRIKQLVTELLDNLQITERWQVEVAAMLSQLGHMTLPPETAQRVYFNQPLSDEETKLVRQLPTTTERLIDNIPRMEAVRAILASYVKPHGNVVLRPGEEAQQPVVQQGAALLRAAVDFETLESEGKEAAFAIDVMRGRAGVYEPRILEALQALRGSQGQTAAVAELNPTELLEGMQLAEDVVLSNGMMLVARGHEITFKSLERIRNLPKGMLKGKLRVLLKKP